MSNRIIALSHSLKPYRFLQNGKQNDRLISPERGQLLQALIFSNLDDKTIGYIKTKVNFSYSEIKNIDIENINLGWMKLKYCLFENCNIRNVNFDNTDLTGTIFKADNTSRYDRLNVQYQINNCSFMGTSFYQVELHNNIFFECDISFSRFVNVKFLNNMFSNCRLIANSFYGCDFQSEYIGTSVILDSKNHIFPIAEDNIRLDYVRYNNYINAKKSLSAKKKKYNINYSKREKYYDVHANSMNIFYATPKDSVPVFFIYKIDE